MKRELRKERALQLLILVDDHTKRAPDGAIEMFWIPRERPQYINFSKYDASGHLAETELMAIDVGGSGDAAILKSLERKGLLQRPKTTLLNRYIYAITEDGRREVENYRSGI
jgi:hypothetical protein